MEIDKLKDMFERQKKFQSMLHNYPIMNLEHRRENINENTLALIVEATEALQETPWKSWKLHSEYNKLYFKKEIIDCWHFLINLSIIAFENEEELYNEFIEKNKINIQRQEEEY